MNHKNGLRPGNYNKAKCATCIFGPTPIELSTDRMNEIYTYLMKMECHHVCHVTQKTCYGALEFQAKVLYSMNQIPEPTAESLLETAQKYLNKNG